MWWNFLNRRKDKKDAPSLNEIHLTEESKVLNSGEIKYDGGVKNDADGACTIFGHVSIVREVDINILNYKIHRFSADEIHNGKRIIVDNHLSISIPKGFIYSKDNKKIDGHLFVAMYPDPSIGANKIQSYCYGAIFFELSQPVSNDTANSYFEVQKHYYEIFHADKESDIITLVENQELAIKYVQYARSKQSSEAYATIATNKKYYTARISFNHFDEHDWNYCQNMLTEWLKTIIIV